VLQTAPRWLSEHATVAAATSLRILLIVVLAVVARALLHRVIRRVVRGVVHEQGRARVPAGRLAQAVAALEGSDEPAGIAARIAAERRRQRAETLGALLRSAVTAVLGLIAGLMVLAELGLDLAPLLAGAGVAGVAIGFGAQSLVKDVLAGMFLLLEDQYGVGDVIDVKEAVGTVEDVGLRITTLRDADGVVWYVRNGEILRVGNQSQGWTDVQVEVAVAADQSPERIVEIARRTVAAMGAEPGWAGRLGGEPQVQLVRSSPDEAPRLRLVVTADPERQDGAALGLERRLVQALDSEGVRLPD